MSRDVAAKRPKPLQVEWGKHIDPKDLDRTLASGKFDTVTLIHNETSTGVMNPLPEICCTLAKYPEVVLILDTVSSFSAMKIDMDALGIDVMLTGSQKALALPPGFSLFSVSEKGFCPRRKTKRPRVLPGFPRVQETAGRLDDADHAKHRPYLRSAVEARRYFRRRTGCPLQAPRTDQRRLFTIG